MGKVPMFEARQITVIGTGLLGGSIGLALREAGWGGRRVGVARRQEVLEEALKRGCFDEGRLEVREGVCGADLIIVATPISAFEGVLGELGRCETGEAVISDVGSTKGYVCGLVWRVLGEAGRRFVGSHPMAGTERRGPGAARGDLFKGRACILTPEQRTSAAAVEKVEGFWRLLGMRVVKMSPEEHDRAVARISHLPHAVAAVLVKLAAEQGGLEIASTGFRDTTRVASGDPELWTDIFLTNREAVLEAFERFGEGLEAFRGAVVRGDRGALCRLLRASQEVRDRWVRETERLGAE